MSFVLKFLLVSAFIALVINGFAFIYEKIYHKKMVKLSEGKKDIEDTNVDIK